MAGEDITATVEVEAFLADWLGRDSALTALHGGAVHPIIVPDSVDLEARPELVAITYRRTATTDRASTLLQATGSAKATFDIRIWGRSDSRGYLAICRAARLVRLKLNGLKTETPEGHFIEAAFVTNEYDDAEEVLQEDASVVMFARVLTVDISYQEVAQSALGGA